MPVLLGHFLFSFFQHFFAFELDFYPTRGYNIGSKKRRNEDRYDDYIKKSPQRLD